MSDRALFMMHLMLLMRRTSFCDSTQPKYGRLVGFISKSFLFKSHVMALMRLMSFYDSTQPKYTPTHWIYELPPGIHAHSYPL
jgi:hypothetical protein